jgi:hypothetical protein
MNLKLLIFGLRAGHRWTSLLSAPNIRRAFTANTWVQNHLGMPKFCVMTCVITLPSRPLAVHLSQSRPVTHEWQQVCPKPT